MGKEQRGPVRRWLLQCRRKIDHWRTQVYVVSYAKCGRTWLHLMLGKAVCTQFGIPEKEILRSHNFTQRAGLRRTIFTHARSLPAYRGKHVLLLVRDPRDVIVSHYCDAGLRRGNFSGTISEFMRDEKYGIARLLEFYRTWNELGKEAETFTLLTYEAMRADPAAALTRTLRLIGVEQPSPQVVADTVAYTSFANMQRMEARNTLGNPALRPKDANDSQTFKVRRGRVGGFRDELCADDVAYLNRAIATQGCPFYAAAPRKPAVA